MNDRAPHVLALVPAFDEERTVAQTVLSLHALSAVDEIVVVADGCSDRTAEEARAAGARVLHTARRMGKGGAVEAALSLVPAADVYLLVDADVGATASRASVLVEAVVRDEADLAVGLLPSMDGGGFGLVKGFAGLSIRLLTGRRTAEPLSGQRAVANRCLEACRPLARGFGLETAMTIDALRAGFRVVEIPVAIRHRPTGRTVAGFVHRGRQGIDILRATAVRALRR
jgi:glycosyltransferase involved in cell wall biosynthesis